MEKVLNVTISASLSRKRSNVSPMNSFLVNNFISQILQAIICVLAEMVNSLFSV